MGVRDYRFIPAAQGVDLLFIRPVKASVIEIRPDGLAWHGGSREVRVFQYNFGLGRPGWLAWGHPSAAENIDSGIAVDEPRYTSTMEKGIDFTRAGLPYFVARLQGLSGVEAWGRWSDSQSNDEVLIEFTSPLPRKFTLELVANAFGPNVGVPIRVRVGSREQFFEIPEGHQNGSYRLAFDNAEAASTIEIFVPKPVRPKDILSGSSDSRLIGIGFVQLRIVEKP